MGKPFEAGKMYQTTTGAQVRVLGTRKCEGRLEVVTLIETRVNHEQLYFYSMGGTAFGGAVSYGDLIPEKETRTGYVNVYPAGRGDIMYANTDAADRGARGADLTRIACVEVTYEVP